MNHNLLAGPIPLVPDISVGIFKAQSLDETSCCTKKRGKIVVPKGKFPFVSEEHSVGHIKTCCTFNAAGEDCLRLLFSC